MILGSRSTTQSPNFMGLNSEFTRPGTRWPTHGKALLSYEKRFSWTVLCWKRASLQGSHIPPGLCYIMQSLYWEGNLLFLSLPYRLVNHWSKHVLCSRSLPCNFWPGVIVKHFLLSCLWSSQCQVRSGSLHGPWARAPTVAGSILDVLDGSSRASDSSYSAFLKP